MSTTPTEPLLREIKAEAARSGMTAAALARAVGMTQSQMARRLSGATPTTLAEFLEISAALDTRPSTFFERAAA